MKRIRPVWKWLRRDWLMGPFYLPHTAIRDALSKNSRWQIWKKNTKKLILGDCWIKCLIIYYQTYVSVAKWPYKEYTPKLAEESGLIYDGSPVTYSNWNRNYLSSLNDTVLQNTLNLNREHSGKGFAKVLCVLSILSSHAHWHLSKVYETQSF